MKIYVTKKGIMLIGKTSEIKEQIKQYMNDYQTVKDLQQNSCIPFK